MGKISDRVSDSVISAIIDSYLTVARANTSELAETQDQRILPLLRGLPIAPVQSADP
jgi:hypothetical protein